MSKTDLFQHYRQAVSDYLAALDPEDIPALAGERFQVHPLAAGEYNLNYLLSSPQRKLVFRINIASQINRPDQIAYEYRALQLLAASGVTPRPLHLDDSRRHLDRGIAIIEYLPGRPLDYRRDLAGAARTLATIHQQRTAGAAEQLIVEEAPLSLLYEECAGLLGRYFHSPLAPAKTRRLLEKILAWMERARGEEAYFQANPWLCVVNTEVNSGNFIVNDQARTTHLIDWEMPRWGDPSSDLCHFCSPLTTRWKSDFAFTATGEADFIDQYRRHLHCPLLRASLDERLRRKTPFVRLRGIAWSAMAWVAYQGEYSGIRNPDTWRRLQEYLDPATIRTVFHPCLGD